MTKIRFEKIDKGLYVHGIYEVFHMLDHATYGISKWCVYVCDTDNTLFEGSFLQCKEFVRQQVGIDKAFSSDIDTSKKTFANGQYEIIILKGFSYVTTVKGKIKRRASCKDGWIVSAGYQISKPVLFKGNFVECKDFVLKQAQSWI